MTVVISILVALHLIGLVGVAVVWGMGAAQNRGVLPGLLHSALLQLVTGLALMGVFEATRGGLSGSTYVKLGTKLAAALVISVLAFIGQRRTKRGEPFSPVAFRAIIALEVLNVIIAVAWPH